MPSENGRPKAFVLISGAGDQPMQSTVPPHLAQTPWIQHEYKSAESAFRDVRRELKRLAKKITEKRVHDSRVALRRFRSVWKVMKEDGWETDKCRKRIMKPLKKLQTLLGELRDIDVSLELGAKLGCTESTLDLWKKYRQSLRQDIEYFVENNAVNDITRALKRFLRKRREAVQTSMPGAKSSQSAFDHLERFLLHQESVVREEAETAQTPEEMHALRLSIKRWRYLLTEFFGVTNLQLVRAQQLLGQLHDLDRLTPLLVHDDGERQALLQLKNRRRDLLIQIEEIRKKLPYGLRPRVTSAKAAAPASFDEPTT